MPRALRCVRGGGSSSHFKPPNIGCSGRLKERLCEPVSHSLFHNPKVMAMLKNKYRKSVPYD